MTKREALRVSFAEQQILGFTSAKEGYNIISLAESMGLTSKEWKKLKPSMLILMRRIDIEELSKHYEEKIEL